VKEERGKGDETRVQEKRRFNKGLKRMSKHGKKRKNKK
jgi:hypothetical protein